MEWIVLHPFVKEGINNRQILGADDIEWALSFSQPGL